MAIYDVIKFEGDIGDLIWKHPCEEFNSQTQLIVPVNYEVVLSVNGLALDVFAAGHYTMDENSTRMLNRVLNRTNGGQAAFHCELYFIHRINQMSIKWETGNKVVFKEPISKLRIAIGGVGEASLQISDSRRILANLLGEKYSPDVQGMCSFFTAALIKRMKLYIPQYMESNSLSIGDIGERLEEFSRFLHAQLQMDYYQCGIALDKFAVTQMIMPEVNN